MIVYRSDTRDPQEISRVGFAPRNVRELDVVKAELLTYCNSGAAEKKPIDLSRLIISSP